MLKCEHGFSTAGSDSSCSGACPIAVTRAVFADAAESVGTLRTVATEYVIAVAVGNPLNDLDFRYETAKARVAGILSMLDEQVEKAKREDDDD